MEAPNNYKYDKFAISIGGKSTLTGNLTKEHFNAFIEDTMLDGSILYKNFNSILDKLPDVLKDIQKKYKDLCELLNYNKNNNFIEKTIHRIKNDFPQTKYRKSNFLSSALKNKNSNKSNSGTHPNGRPCKAIKRKCRYA